MPAPADHDNGEIKILKNISISNSGEGGKYSEYLETDKKFSGSHSEPRPHLVQGNEIGIYGQQKR